MCQALVNIVRVREGAALLQRRLDDNLLSGFQDGVKLLVSDTNLSDNVKVRERAREEEREGERARERERERTREREREREKYNSSLDITHSYVT